MTVSYDCRLLRVEEKRVISGTSTSIETAWTWKHKKGTVVLRTKGDVPDFPRIIGTDFKVEVTHMQTSISPESQKKSSKAARSE